MSSSSSAEPATIVLAALRGMTFRARLLLFEDKRKTEPLLLSGLTVKFVIDGYLTLIAGSGLTVLDVINGVVLLKLEPAQTLAAPTAIHTCHMVVEENGVELDCPLRGTITFTNP